jgi:hypothetical protein
MLAHAILAIVALLSGNLIIAALALQARGLQNIPLKNFV